MKDTKMSSPATGDLFLKYADAESIMVNKALYVVDRPSRYRSLGYYSRSDVRLKVKLPKNRRYQSVIRADVTNHILNCCGITELEMSDLAWKLEALTTKVPTEALAFFLVKRMLFPLRPNPDGRFVIWGSVVHRARGEDSRYAGSGYRQIEDALSLVGFAPLGDPYVNKNSDNTIQVWGRHLPYGRAQ